MNARQRVFLALLVLLLPAMAGCNAQDWWDVQGTLTIGVTAAEPDESPIEGYRQALSEFQALRVGIIGVSIKQAGELNPRHYSFQDEPLVVDLVDLEKRDAITPLVEEKVNLRAIEAVTLTIAGLEAVTASGEKIPFCFPGQRGVTKPCVSMPATGNYRHTETPFSPPRGGSVDFAMTLEVLYSPEANEYVVFRDPDQAVIVTS